MDHILGLDPIDHQLLETDDEFQTQAKPDIDELYEIVKSSHVSKGDPLPEVNPQHPSLIPALRPYQKSAVKWMVAKEREAEAATEVKEGEKSLHGLYTPVMTKEGDQVS